MTGPTGNPIQCAQVSGSVPHQHGGWGGWGVGELDNAGFCSLLSEQ